MDDKDDEIAMTTTVTSATTESIEKHDTEQQQQQQQQRQEDQPKKAYWKPKGKNTRWQERMHFNDLQVGQELFGHVVQELLDGKTGPKLFLDCGVGRTDKSGNWYMVNAMLRLPRTGKASVVRKRAAKYRSRDRIPVYVSRIQLGCGQLEVCLDPEEVERYARAPPKVPVTSFRSGQIIQGTVHKLYPYGVTVDVGANRRGLLHIKKVSSLYGRYIDKEKGLIEAGLEMGAKVRLMVESVDQRRLFLDFTPDVREEADQELAQEKKRNEQSTTLDQTDLDDWAEYAEKQSTIERQQNADSGRDNDESDVEDDDEEEEYDEYDEESDIEEALGLDMY